MAGPIPMEGMFVDRTGREITFTYHRDFERENRGFIVDNLEAWHGDEKVGYIKCEYFTKESFAAFHPTIWNYVSQMTGKLIMPFGSETRDPRNGDPELFRHMAISLSNYRMVRAEPDREFTTYSEFQDWVKSSVFRDSMSDMQKGYRQFRDRIDFPFVAYVNVERSERQGIRVSNRNLGIGSELYRRMALELAERGLLLRSSTLQSSHAVRMWEGLERKGWVVREGDRFRLVPEALAEAGSAPRLGA